MDRCIQQRSACKGELQRTVPTCGEPGSSSLAIKSSAPAAMNWSTLWWTELFLARALLSGVSGESSQFWHAGIAGIALASLATR